MSSEIQQTNLAPTFYTNYSYNESLKKSKENFNGRIQNYISLYFLTYVLAAKSTAKSQ